MKKLMLGFIAAGICAGLQAQTLKVSTAPDPKGKTLSIPAWLPLQDLRIEFVLLREEFTRGELADYTPQYFSNAGYIQESGVRYTIKNVEIVPISRADASTLYYLTPGEGTRLGFSDAGILRSVNMPEPESMPSKDKKQPRPVSDGHRQPEKSPMLSMVTRFDTVITREISVDSTIIERRKINRIWVKNEAATLAKELIEKINDIREKRYFLITGPEDVMIDGTGIQASVKELEILEQQYLEMFFGRRSYSVETRSFIISPGNKKDEEFNLATFSYADAWNGNALPVKVTLKADAPAPAQGNPGSGLPVAVPARTEVSVSIGNTVYASETLMLTKKGSIQYLPLGTLKKVQLLFDEKSGALLNIGN